MGEKVANLWQRLIHFQNKMEEIIDSIEDELTSCYLILPSDIIEYDDCIEIKIDVPGIEEKNIKIFFDENYLIIEGEKIKDIDNANVSYILAERRFGKFKNIINIPSNFDKSKFTTYIKDGVLFIKIFKIIPKKIEIEEV